MVANLGQPFSGNVGAGFVEQFEQGIEKPRFALMFHPILFLRQKNNLMISPAQAAYVCAVWILSLIAVVSNVLSLLLASDWSDALQWGSMLFIGIQICGPLSLSTVPLLLHYRKMTTARYVAVDRCNRLVVNILSRFFFFSPSFLRIIKADWGLNRVWLGDAETAESVLREVVSSLETSHFKGRSIHNALLYNNLSYAILKNGGSLEDAETAAIKAIDIFRAAKVAANSPLALFPLTNLGVVYFLRDDYAGAEVLLVKALSCQPPGSLTMDAFPSQFLRTRVNALLWLTVAAFKQSNDEAAMRRLRESLQLIALHSDCVALECLDALSRVASELTARGYFQESEVLLERGYSVAADNPGFADNKAILESYEGLLQQTARSSEIADLKRWIRPVSLLQHDCLL
ncbi:MAG TPA: tetratricopeptide repeat protein [Oculatellaceae cyanobacterium]